MQVMKWGEICKETNKKLSVVPAHPTAPTVRSKHRFLRNFLAQVLLL